MGAVAAFVVRVGVLRAGAIWLLGHMVLLLAEGGNITSLPFRAVLVLAVAAGWVTSVFSQRSNELTFLANLGVPGSVVVAASAAAVLAFEMALRLLLPVRGA